MQDSEFEARKLAATVVSIDKQIVWRPITGTLPEVAPEANTPRAAEAQGTVTSTDQVIIALPKIPTKSPQYIQGPTNKTEALVSSPNMIGFKSRMTKRAFIPPPAPEAPPERDLLPPPVFASNRFDISRLSANGLAVSEIRSKPPIRQFNPPPDHSRSAKVEIPAVLLEQAPALPVTNPLLQSSASSPQLRPHPLPALPNSAHSGENSPTDADAGAITLAPPTLQNEMNAAIISLTPADNLQQLARGSREGDFSRAPIPGPPRRDDADADASKLPGLKIGPPANRSGLENPSARATRNQPPLNTPSLSIPLLPRARQLDIVLERHFQGKNVYITAVPAIAQTSKDLTIWFSEHETVGGRPLIRPPMLLRKISSDSMGNGNSGRTLYISGIISTGGTLHHVSVLGDQFGAAELVHALEGWEFSPALRNGVPIEVDIVIGIPLNPPPARAGQ